MFRSNSCFEVFTNVPEEMRGVTGRGREEGRGVPQGDTSLHLR